MKSNIHNFKPSYGNCILCNTKLKYESIYEGIIQVNGITSCSKCEIYIEDDDGEVYCDDKKLLKKFNDKSAELWEKNIKKRMKM